jgi:hypothetical protein
MRRGNCVKELYANGKARFRDAVQAAAEKTNTFATITGHAPMIAP